MQINILYIACRRSFNQTYICISSPYTRWPIKRRWCLYKLKWQLATPFLVAPTFDGNCKLQLTYACTLTSVCTRMYENIMSLCVGAPIFKSCWCRCSSLSGITGNARKVHFNCPTIMLNAHAHMHTYVLTNTITNLCIYHLICVDSLTHKNALNWICLYVSAFM